MKTTLHTVSRRFAVKRTPPRLERAVEEATVSETFVKSPEPSPKALPRGVSAAVGGAVPGPLGPALAEQLKPLDPYDAYAWDRAEKQYEVIRETSTDVDRIAEHTPYSHKDIKTIKAHLFLNDHILDERVGRFDADPMIANAWVRLDQGQYQQKDLQLLEHELFEARFESLFQTDYRTAHDAANRSGRTSGL